MAQEILTSFSKNRPFQTESRKRRELFPRQDENLHISTPVAFKGASKQTAKYLKKQI